MGPACVPQSETKNWPYLGLDGPNRDSEGKFSPTCGGQHPSDWLKHTARRGFCPPVALSVVFWGVLASACPRKKGSKWFPPKSDPGPLWVTADVLLARSKAYLGRFDRPYVPNSLRGEPFWDQKRVKSRSKLYFFGCALGPIGVLKRLPLAHFVASLDCLDMICKNVWKGKCIKNEDEAKGPANGRY